MQNRRLRRIKLADGPSCQVEEYLDCSCGFNPHRSFRFTQRRQESGAPESEGTVRLPISSNETSPPKRASNYLGDQTKRRRSLPRHPNGQRQHRPGVPKGTRGWEVRIAERGSTPHFRPMVSVPSGHHSSQKRRRAKLKTQSRSLHVGNRCDLGMRHLPAAKTAIVAISTMADDMIYEGQSPQLCAKADREIKIYSSTAVRVRSV